MLDLKDTSVDPWYGYTPHTIERYREISRGAKSAYLRTPSVEIFETIVVELQSHRLATLDDRLLHGLLLSAAQDGWTDMAKHLISRGAPMDRPKHVWRETSLWRACKKGHEKVVQMLPDNGAQPCDLEFEVAAAHGHVSTMKVLLGSEAAANPVSTKDCLYAAARKGFVSVVQLMLDFGVDPNNGDIAPLIGAMESEHTTIFWMLVQRGALGSKILPEAQRRAEAQGLESMLVLLHEAH
jgi:hypothetical protein